MQYSIRLSKAYFIEKIFQVMQATCVQEVIGSYLQTLRRVTKNEGEQEYCNYAT